MGHSFAHCRRHFFPHQNQFQIFGARFFSCGKFPFIYFNYKPFEGTFLYRTFNQMRAYLIFEHAQQQYSNECWTQMCTGLILFCKPSVLFFCVFRTKYIYELALVKSSVRIFGKIDIPATDYREPILLIYFLHINVYKCFSKLSFLFWHSQFFSPQVY